MQQGLLSTEFLRQYPNQPKHMTALGQFVYTRTYSRYLEDKQRREYWKETVRRATEFNLGLKIKHLVAQGISYDLKQIQHEAELLFDDMFNLRRFLSGRTLWVGGANNGLAERYALANFNCAFTNVRKWHDLVDLFYLLMVGAGAGFKVTKAFAQNLPPLRKDITVVHKEYLPVEPRLRKDNTMISLSDRGRTMEIVIGDSKEGWVESLRAFFDTLSADGYVGVTKLILNYDNIRLKGERLKTFGGTASGHTSILDMYRGIVSIIHNELDPYATPPKVEYKHGREYVRVRPIHVMDMANLIGQNVVVGGVRRTAEIFLFDADDYESMFAKYGINGFWSEEHFENHHKITQLLEDLNIPVPYFFEALSKKMYLVQSEDGNSHYYDTQEEAQEKHPGAYVMYPTNPGRTLHHRRMSNNSIAFTDKPSDTMMDLLMHLMKLEGEPGFINLRTAAVRRLRARGTELTEEAIQLEMENIGLNPCAEILLNDKGVCNLSTTNAMAFVNDNKFDVDGFVTTLRRNVEACMHMTLIDLELPEWDATQKRDRLLGISITGWKDAMGSINASAEDEKGILRIAGDAIRQHTTAYADALQVNRPLLSTTVKPEGTQSLVAGGVSSGLHYSHSPYYIRRIRVNASDALAKAVRYLGWDVKAELGTEGDSDAERLKNASTVVVGFPIKSGAKKTKDDISADEQLDTYFNFQKYYTDHNSSNTITVRPEEWSPVGRRILNQWESFVAVSFLAHSGGTYELAPYEAITKEKYQELKANEKAFVPEALVLFENGEDFDIEEACKEGVCAPR